MSYSYDRFVIVILMYIIWRRTFENTPKTLGAATNTEMSRTLDSLHHMVAMLGLMGSELDEKPGRPCVGANALN